MGSLMAGWNSPAQDPEIVKLRRNNSSTKDEIDAFWKTKKQTEEEHLRHISALSPRSQMHVLDEEAKQRYQTSVSEPLPVSEEEEEENAKSFLKKHGWWISSNWAFLNEPPVIEKEDHQHKYTPQFHVAEVGSSKTTNAQTQTGVGA